MACNSIKRNLVTLRLLINMKQPPGKQLETRHNLYTLSLNSCLSSKYSNYNSNKLFSNLHLYIKRTLTCGSTALRNCDKSENNSTNTFSDQSMFENLTKDLYHHPGIGHNILLIQPRIKYGRNNEKRIVSECKMGEAVALVNTLPGWKVIEKVRM